MRMTVVPAQVTTVEDRIIGNLSLSQTLLIIVPVFVGAGLFALLPPLMEPGVYKYVLITIITSTCAISAIRVRGEIIAAWLIVLIRYFVRPRYYVYEKNVMTSRRLYAGIDSEAPKEDPIVASMQIRIPRLGFPETEKVLATIESSGTDVRYETTKNGGLHVRISKTPQ